MAFARGEFADKFNGMPKYVVSSTLSDPDWNNSTVIGATTSPAGSPGCRDEVDGEILVNGSLQLVATLLEHGLVDEYRLMVFPTVLGAGKRLFGETGEPAKMKLAESRPVGAGRRPGVDLPARRVIDRGGDRELDFEYTSRRP